MKLFLNPERDIYFNLALEEYLLKNSSEDYFMLWHSETSVVVGKHQNAMAEINHGYLKKAQIPVARRLSGGGTVYHGPGNINFTFILNGEQGKLVDFKRFVAPVVDYLATLGIKAEIGTRNDILIDGLKISGNAEHVFKKRVLHHGTLLFNADLESLNTAIKVKAGKFKDKAVQSNRSVVTNISNYLQEAITIEAFAEGLISYMHTRYTEAESYTAEAQDVDKIRKLRNEKYATPEWIYAYSPPFEVREQFVFDRKTVSLFCVVKKGIVEVMEVRGLNPGMAKQVEEAVTGTVFLYTDMYTRLSKAEINTELAGLVVEALF